MSSEIAFYELDENKKWQVSFIVKYITFVLRKHEKCLKLIERILSALLKTTTRNEMNGFAFHKESQSRIFL